MAKLQFYRQRTTPQVIAPDVRGLARIESPAAQIAESIGQLARIGAEINEKRRATKLDDLNAKATTELNNFVLSLETDTDYETQIERYDQRVQEIENRVKEEAGDDSRLFNAWRREFTVPVTARSFDVRKRAQQGIVGKERAALDDRLYQFSQLPGSGNPELDSYAISQGILALDNALANGFITPEEEANLRQAFQRNANMASANKAIADNPDAFIVAVEAGQFGNLSNEDRNDLINKARTAAETLDNRIRQAEERQQKEIEDATRMEGDDLVANGTLTRQWVQNHRDDLSPEQYRYLLKEVTGGAASTNNTIYSSLLTRASSGQDVTAEVRQEYSVGNLTKEDFNKLISLSTGSGWYKRGSQFITQALRVSDLNPDPAAPQRLANAMNDWIGWSQSIDVEKMSDKQAMEEAHRIVSEYSIINFQDAILTLRAPRFLVGSRNEPNLEATEDETLRALEEGRITEQEFTTQSALINQWRSSIEMMRRMQTPTDTGAR